MCALLLLLSACRSSDVVTEPPVSSSSIATVRDCTARVLEPAADGLLQFSNEYAVLDASHTDQGYVMVKYLGQCQNVRVQVIGPGESETYTYYLETDSSWQVFPLTCGDGSYTVRLLENVEDDSYAIALTQDLDVNIQDEFLPFLYPNRYVNFTATSAAVLLGETIAQGASTDLDVITRIYHYVIENISYDTAKAENIQYGYIPDVDKTLESGSGICFDYAALMTAMLRSQGIPTKLETGYSGEASHAWLSAYVDDIGWIDNIIEFDGSGWHLLDPTLAANNTASAVSQYIGDGSHYTLKYTY
jgi:transglutaminase-like putative cysteine protease